MRRVISLMISITILILFNINDLTLAADDDNISNYSVDIKKFNINNKGLNPIETSQ